FTRKGNQISHLLQSSFISLLITYYLWSSLTNHSNFHCYLDLPALQYYYLENGNLLNIFDIHFSIGFLFLNTFIYLFWNNKCYINEKAATVQPELILLGDDDDDELIQTDSINDDTDSTMLIISSSSSITVGHNSKCVRCMFEYLIQSFVPLYTMMLIANWIRSNDDY
ncbi:unnamed protein product, partial [Didymodactylos carnosus]